METAKRLLDTHSDYVNEMLNIAAGNAATALSHLLCCRVNIKRSEMKLLHGPDVVTFLADPDTRVACLRMKLGGDLTGYMFFLVPHSQETKLVELAAAAITLPIADSQEAGSVLDALAEIGNILTGAYLGAIHGFCRLTIFHSVPCPSIDMLQALLDEYIANQSREARAVLLITVEFTISDEAFETFLLICPSWESCTALVDSISGAERNYGIASD